VRDPDAWEAALDRAGDVDVVLNIAGILQSGWVHENPVRDIQLQVDVNVKGVMFGTRAAARRMVPRGRGHIVNIASLSALTPVPGLAVYGATKYAVRAFSLSAAQELRPRGVRVTVVCPDAVATPMMLPQKDRAEAALAFSGPRLLTVEQVGRAILGALRSRPLEVWIPRWRGWMVRAADLFPRIAFGLEPVFRRLGRRHQER
jgi:3-oxoacyl-[acyl-carrier protein] reductase